MARMADEYQIGQQHLERAIALAVKGDQAAAITALRPIWTKSDGHMFRLWQALAETAIWPLRHQPAGGPRFGLEVFAPYAGTDTDDLPQSVRLALRFLAAQAQHDRDTLEALFRAPLHARDSLVMAEVMVILLDAAAESARAQQARTDARRGTFGNGQ
jgi:hypothetical protein